MKKLKEKPIEERYKYDQKQSFIVDQFAEAVEKNKGHIWLDEDEIRNSAILLFQEVVEPARAAS